MASWLKKLRKPSFRGVPLQAVDGVSTETPIRTAEHEYPGIPGGWVEHLDRGLRAWSLTVTYTGADYYGMRDQLETALDFPAPGLLVHPTRGEVQASVSGAYTVTERDGTATFQITFRESGRPTAVSAGTPSTGSALLSRVEDGLSAVAGAFADTFSVASLPSWARAETIDAVTAQVESIRETIEGPVGQLAENATEIIASLRDLEAEIQTLVDTPAILAARYSEILRQIQHLGVYRLLTGDAGIPDPAAGLTPTADDVAANEVESARALLRMSLCAWGETVQATTWDSFDAAEDEALILADRIGAELEYTLDDTEYQALLDLQVALAAYLDAQGARLPRLIEVTQGTPASVLELAQRWHADADRADEIRARNGLIDPVWVTGDLWILGVA